MIRERMTYDAYSRLPEGAPYQLIDGCLVHEPSPTVEHQRIASRLAFALTEHARRHDAGEIFFSPIDVRLSETETYQPDIVFVSHARRGILEAIINGAPDLVIEILSPSTGYYDLTHKRRVYERHGVLEYWIVDPLEHTVTVLGIASDRYVELDAARDEGIARSTLLDGFTVDLASLFAMPAW
jgi:Uma2 family endonuclease